MDRASEGAWSLNCDDDHELVVDLFAGAGGASLGMARAYREPDVAVNHNPIAIAVHLANHPNTKHLTCDVFEVDPVEATGGRRVGVLWASPDCTHFSKAKGGAPRSKRVRGLAWVVIRWAASVRPRLILLENVEEFATWGPLLDNGQPCPARKGLTFRRWRRELEKLGCDVELKELRAYTQGTRTIRKRLYIVARCDGQPIVWPADQFGDPKSEAVLRGTLRPWGTAAECIDWSVPGRSIFDRPKPLAKNTCRRIAKGLWRFTLNHPSPFIVPLRGTSASHRSSHAVDVPLSTVSAGGTHHAVVVPHITKFRTGSVGSGVDEPMPTVTAGGAMKRPAGAAHALGVVGVHLQDATDGQPYIVTNTTGHPGASCEEPLRAITTGGHHMVVEPFLTEFANASTRRNFAVDEPLRTQCAQVKGGHFALVSPTLIEVAHSSESPSGVKRWGDGVKDLQAPMSTVTAGGVSQAVVGMHLLHLTHHGERPGYPLDEPVRTVTGAHRGEQAVCGTVLAPWMEQANGGPHNAHKGGVPIDRPVSTVCVSGSHQQLAAAHLSDVHESATEALTKARMGWVEFEPWIADALSPDQLARARQVAAFVHEYLPEHFPVPGELVIVGNRVVTDITLRMLMPRELARANGFPDTYVLDRGFFVDPVTGVGEWRAITKTDQVRLIGNAVCSEMAEALVRANATDLIARYGRIAA